VIPFVVAGAVVAGVAWYGVSAAAKAVQAEARTARRRVVTRRRVRQGSGVLLDAAVVDAAFDPDATIGLVRNLVSLADAVWRQQEPQLKRPGSRLVRDWATEFEAGNGEIAGVIGTPSIGVLDVVNRSDVDEDRVSVRVTMRLRMGQRTNWTQPRAIRCDTRWTLVRSGGDWRPVEIEPYTGDPSTQQRPFIARPSDDTQRLRESSMNDLARRDEPAAAHLGDLVAHDAPAYRALLELSVIDGRYAPALIEASLTHLLGVWETASVGAREPLRLVADGDAIDGLLYSDTGADRHAVIVRDLRLRDWKPTDLGRDAQPPTVLVELTADGVCYRVTEAGSLLLGDQIGRRRLRLQWTLALADDAPIQWRLHQTTAPRT
jgi:hypothetical protein